MGKGEPISGKQFDAGSNSGLGSHFQHGNPGHAVGMVRSREGQTGASTPV